ncbi:MAG: FMN-binding negative transcriptional regulator [Chitinophagaceae bacterium]
MYKTSYFRAKDSKQIMDFMHANPFVTICGVDEHQQPIAAQVPVIVVEKNSKLYIQGHFMRKQDHTIAFEKNSAVLVIFSSPSAYVSASWYPIKNVASTWNYQSVYCKGNLAFVNNDSLFQILDTLTNRFEKNDASEASIHKMTPAYLQSTMKAIVGFEIEVTDVNEVFKLSQNKDAETRNNIVKELLNSNDSSARYIANEMLKNE